MEFRQDAQILSELGERFAQLRIRHEVTQEALAAKAGLSRGVLRRFEKSGVTTLTNLIKLCRALGLTKEIDQLFKLPGFSPMEAFKKKKPLRQRVRHKQISSPSKAGETK